MQRFKHGKIDLHYFGEPSDLLALVTPQRLDELLAREPGSWRPAVINSIRRTNDLDWYGGLTYDEAHQMATTGCTVDTAALALRDELVTELRERTEQSFAWDMAGDAVDVGAFVTGEPECMLTTREDRVRKRDNVTLLLGIGANQTVHADKLRWRGLAYMALVDALQSTQRYSVEAYGYYGTDGQGTGALVTKLVSPDRAYDPQEVGFWLAHPAAFRRMGFGYMAQLSDADAQRWYRQNTGLGRPSDLRSLPAEITDVNCGSTGNFLSANGNVGIHNEASARRWVSEQLERIVQS